MARRRPQTSTEINLQGGDRIGAAPERGIAMNKIDPISRQGPFDLDIEKLLHPARAFQHPQHVVGDPDLTLNEKRAILASWASDACAIEATPELRQAPGTAQPARYDDVMDALRALDRQASGHYRAPPRYRRVLENRIPGVFGRKSKDRGTSGHGQTLN
jgi:hypothetical protein